MKKIKAIYLNDDNKLLLIDTKGRQYRVDYYDYKEPRFIQISKDNIDYEKNIKERED